MPFLWGLRVWWAGLIAAPALAIPYFAVAGKPIGVVFWALVGAGSVCGLAVLNAEEQQRRTTKISAAGVGHATSVSGIIVPPGVAAGRA